MFVNLLESFYLGVYGFIHVHSRFVLISTKCIEVSCHGLRHHHRKIRIKSNDSRKNWYAYRHRYLWNTHTLFRTKWSHELYVLWLHIFGIDFVFSCDVDAKWMSLSLSGVINECIFLMVCSLCSVYSQFSMHFGWSISDLFYYSYYNNSMWHDVKLILSPSRSHARC